MNADERIAAIGEILATGFLRLSLGHRKALEDGGRGEAPCAATSETVPTATSKEATWPTT